MVKLNINLNVTNKIYILKFKSSNLFLSLILFILFIKSSYKLELFQSLGKQCENQFQYIKAILKISEYEIF
jgi:hypothetical protein